jgi:hypothetical protein
MRCARMTATRILGRAAAAIALLGLMPAAAVTAGAGPAVAGSAPARPAGTISTTAGGVGGPGRGTTVSLGSPCGVSAAGNSLYVADGSTLRKVNENNDWLTTPAGTGVLAGLPGTGGPATDAELDTCGAVRDHAGNLVITDQQYDFVRVLATRTGTFYGQPMTAGDIYTVAGDGTRGFSGDGGRATSAELDSPDRGVADAHGNLVIADTVNNRIRVVAEHTGTFYRRAMTAGRIYTVAGDGTYGFSGDGGPATSAALASPASAAVDAAGNVLIADGGNFRVRVVAEHTGTFYGQAMTAGDIYTVAGDGDIGYTGDGGPATSTGLWFPLDAEAGPAGQLLIADSGDNRVRSVTG